MKTIQSEIRQACERTEPFTKERNKALAKIKWRLRCGLLYAGLGRQAACILTDEAHALVFDGRDNEQTKLAYWQAVTGYKFEVELCERRP